jgi:hypothetical protein
MFYFPLVWIHRSELRMHAVATSHVDRSHASSTHNKQKVKFFYITSSVASTVSFFWTLHLLHVTHRQIAHPDGD